MYTSKRCPWFRWLVRVVLRLEDCASLFLWQSFAVSGGRPFLGRVSKTGRSMKKKHLVSITQNNWKYKYVRCRRWTQKILSDLFAHLSHLGWNFDSIQLSKISTFTSGHQWQFYHAIANYLKTLVPKSLKAFYSQYDATCLFFVSGNNHKFCLENWDSWVFTQPSTSQQLVSSMQAGCVACCKKLRLKEWSFPYMYIHIYISLLCVAVYQYLAFMVLSMSYVFVLWTCAALCI